MQAKAKRKPVFVLSPNGHFFLIKDGEISKFCRRFGLERTGINKLVNRKVKTINGWSLHSVF